MFKIMAAIYTTFWVMLAVNDVGTITVCSGKPITAALPAIIMMAVVFTMWLGYMIGKENDKQT